MPEHEFISYVEADQAFYSYPINMQDVRSMPDSSSILSEMNDIKQSNYSLAKNAQNLEEYWIGGVGQTLYDKIIDKYTRRCGKLIAIVS